MSIAVEARAGLRPDGLSEEQLLHFAEHGWVLLERAIDPDLCRACREADQRMIDKLTCGRTRDPSDRGNNTAFREPHMHEPVFCELYKTPGLLPAARQLIGHDKVRYIYSVTTITDPDHERHTRPDVVNDRRTWGWHRSFRPRDVLRPHETDARLINSSLIAIGMYFVPTAPEHGVTAFMDKSHTYDGSWARSEDIYDEVGDRFEVVQPTTAEAGTIVLFSEAILHTPAPVLSEQRRFAYFTFLAVPWFNRYGQAPYQEAYFADQGLRDLFAPCVHYDPADDPAVG